jgi:hypothetical protein
MGSLRRLKHPERYFEQTLGCRISGNPKKHSRMTSVSKVWSVARGTADGRFSFKLGPPIVLVNNFELNGKNLRPIEAEIGSFGDVFAGT